MRGKEYSHLQSRTQIARPLGQKLPAPVEQVGPSVGSRNRAPSGGQLADLMGFVSLLRLHTHQYSEAMKRRDEARRLGDSLDARGLSHDQNELAAELEERADRLQDSRAELILEIIDEMIAATAANRVDSLLTKRKRGRPPGPTRAQMLDDLRSGRISPEQLANLKDEALGAEYRVPKTTAVEARNRALVEFDGNSR